MKQGGHNDVEVEPRRCKSVTGDSELFKHKTANSNDSSGTVTCECATSRSDAKKAFRL